MSSISNDIIEIHNYINYISRSIYYNYINTETGIALSRLFVVLLFVSVFNHYDLFVFFLIIVIILEISSYTHHTSTHTSSWLCIWPEIRKYVSIDNNNSVISNILNNNDNNNSRVHYHHRTLIESLTDLTNGILLNETNSSHVLEGFSIPSITIAKGDNSGRDYHSSSNFLKLNNQEFSDNYFESKKCGYSGGIGSISFFGSNEIIGNSRDVIMSSVYDFKGNIKDPFKYFKDCVYEPIKRNDFRPFKKQVFTDINDNIMNINDVLSRFSNDIMNINKNNNYILDNIFNHDDNIKLTESVFNRIDDNTKLTESVFNRINDKSEEQYMLLIKKVNNEKDPDYDIKYKSRKLEIYNNVYEYKTKLNEFFERIETQYKNQHNNIGTISISDTTLQELRQIINYLRVVQMSLYICNIDINNKIYYNINNFITSSNTGTFTPPVINTDFSKVKIYENDMDKSYNTPDEQRYLWGISYYYNNNK